MASASEILTRIEPLSNLPGFSEAKRFLADPSARYHEDGGNNRVAAGAVAHGYAKRLQFARNKGATPPVGLEPLVEALKGYAPNTVLEGAMFESERELSVFFFDVETGAPVGFVVGKPNPRSRANYKFAMGQDQD